MRFVLPMLAVTFAGCVVHRVAGGGPDSTMLGASINGLAAAVVLYVLHRRGWRRLVAVGATLLAVGIWIAVWRWHASVTAPEVDPVRPLSLDLLGPVGMVATLVLLAASGCEGRPARVVAGLASLVLLASWVVPQSFAVDVLSSGGDGAEVPILGEDGRLATARWERLVVTGVPFLLLPARVANEGQVAEIARGIAMASNPGHDALRSAMWGWQRAFTALSLVGGALAAIVAPLATAFRLRPLVAIVAGAAALPFAADLVLVVPSFALPEAAPMPLLAWSSLGVGAVALAWSAAR